MSDVYLTLAAQTKLKQHIYFRLEKDGSILLFVTKNANKRWLVKHHLGTYRDKSCCVPDDHYLVIEFQFSD